VRVFGSAAGPAHHRGRLAQVRPQLGGLHLTRRDGEQPLELRVRRLERSAAARRRKVVGGQTRPEGQHGSRVAGGGWRKRASSIRSLTSTVATRQSGLP
jgi:hypothetical protein